ncbi:hexitol phosphatase HxpB [Parashewanella curva]|uniref:Hexitol phosphatase HxpB n=1 Tax=Parashewanella curva TaxID=2338552 RepID=A0A3L8PT76_9GAMM|nr:hexitol phosphatase HxpB [Parashewanella curva]RLV58601.1 hexitol phosphatase HxpB [Parashewanella curva]
MSLNEAQAVIFDMDGVLINSEPVWQQAELEVLPKYGVPLTYEDTLMTTGMRVDLLVDYWHQRYPWTNYDNNQVSQQLVTAVVDFIHRDGQPMNGVIDALSFCQRQGFKIGLATSSPMVLVDAVLDTLNIRHYFEAIKSAEKLAYGKPHPEVYLNCASELGVDPSRCVAIEDSFNGLIAARAASMQTIAIPAKEQQQQSRWVIAHEQLEDLTQLASVFMAGAVTIE